MPHLLFSPAAQNDLENIYDYTLETWGLNQAEHYLRNLHQVCNHLATQKTKGRNADFIRQGYFKKSVGAHFIFYRHPNQKTLEVVRILHQKMNVEAHLQ
jgi:toxin ParE1/3/4